MVVICSWINRFRISNVKIGIIFMCLFAICYGAISTYIGAMVTTIEKRFEFNSIEMGLLLGANDIGYLMSIVFVAYFGSRNGRQPLMLFLSAVGLWFSSMVYVLPYAIYGSKYDATDLLSHNYSHSSSSSASQGFCGRNATIVSTSKVLSGDLTLSEKSVTMLIMMVAGIINGVATTPFWNLGVALLDDMAGPSNSGIYIGILFGTRSCAPIMGFLVGSRVLQYHESLKLTIDQYAPGQKDIRWIGAWWLGWLTLGFSVLITAPFLLLLYAKKKNVTVDDNEVQKDSMIEKNLVNDNENLTLLDSFKDLFSILKTAFKNRIYTTLVLGMIFEVLSFVCLINFFTKYLEYHYRASASFVNSFAGFSLAGSSVAASLISGITAHFFKMNMRNKSLYHAVVNSISALAFPILFIFVCPSAQIAGLTNQSRDLMCSNDCSCPILNLQPVCIQTKTFFSPCVAGCHTQINNTNFQGCGCNHAFLARKGFCEEMCPSIYGFLIAFFVIRIIGSMASVQFTQMILGLMESKNKAISMSVLGFLFGICGFALPPLAGSVLDAACRYRNVNRHGLKSQCLIYDNNTLRYLILGVAFSLQIPACLLYILSWWWTPADYKFGQSTKKVLASEKKEKSQQQSEETPI